MGDEDVDTSLFPNAASAKEQDEIWSGGQEEAARANPQGTLQLEIVNAVYGPSASSGRMQIHYELKILGNEHKGITVHKYDGLGSPKQASITQSQLKRLGVDTTKITVKVLPAHLLNLKGKKVQATAKQNGEFYNILFQKLLGEAVGGDARPNSAAAPAGGGGKRPTAKKF